MKELSQYALLTEKEKLEFLELVIGEKDVNDMNSKITYTNEPMEIGEVVKDFLPSPDQLVPKGKSKTNQVTLELTEESVSFFKAQADRKQISYEKIIELLIEQYAHECISDD
jgi:predicted DNA binding CopG/RHH family protein